MGTYRRRVNSMNQIALPKQLEIIFLERQGKKSISDCKVYIKKTDKEAIIIDDLSNIPENEFPKYFPLHIGKEQRFICPFRNLEWIVFKGLKNKIILQPE